MDFPRHFCTDGLTCTDYPAGRFVFATPALVDLGDLPDDTLIERDLVEARLDQLKPAGIKFAAIDILLLRTGAFRYRGQRRYWEHGPGLAPGLADWVRAALPSCRTIGVDCISITAFQHRKTGRMVHRELLCGESPFVLIEDMDLSHPGLGTLKEVIALPLRIEDGDGAPATIIGRRECI